MTELAEVIGGIDHVAIAVRDADAAIATYTRRLGYVVVGDEPVDAAGVRLVYLAHADQAPGHTVLQLVQTLAAGPVGEFLANHGEGLHHVCFATTDIQRALRAAGDSDTSGVFVGGRGLPCAFLSDQPHGARIEFTQLLHS
jgi:methylmalonyl-CoA epimerase